MSVRVCARVRPLLKQELDKDVIIEVVTSSPDESAIPSIVRLPNPKNEAEAHSFQFNSVYDQHVTQQELFDAEVAPTVKHLYKGFDVTLFAYGVTGTGKTHTMRGGKALADRGVIPRMLSSIYRRGRKIEKDSGGETTVDVVMSYYEIYNDRVFDLFEPPEKRTSAGLPIRDNGGKSVVVGLTERPCTTLKKFEQLYDQANLNRSTSATKLNAHSSRSHAILCVKVTQTTGDQVRVSTASAIDLAGSEDNRRTDNGKERLIESSAINKSLFVLAQCVEAISKKQSRIPYRESKMTRVLSLGQNNGLTVMILNLSPVRSYHLDTISSLNFANRTKKIEVNEIENKPFFRPGTKLDVAPSTLATSAHRQPLRPKTFSANIIPKEPTTKTDKPLKAFAVYADKSRLSGPRQALLPGHGQKKRPSTEALSTIGRPAKMVRPSDGNERGGMTQESIEALIERKVTEKLAESALNAALPAISTQELPSELQARLAALERRVEGQETERAEGLQFLLMAKQHQVRGEDASALRMYQLAVPFFPGNERLGKKMLVLQNKLRAQKEGVDERNGAHGVATTMAVTQDGDQGRRGTHDDDDDYHDQPAEQHDEGEDSDFAYRKKVPKPGRRHVSVFRDEREGDLGNTSDLDERACEQSPRTKVLLRIVNSRDVSQIRLLRGVGAKKAEAIIKCLCELDDEHDSTRDGEAMPFKQLRDLRELGSLKGVGLKGMEKMREGLVESC